MTALTFGKHKGTDIKDIPVDYLEWGVNKLDSLKWRKIFQEELDRRNNNEKQKQIFIKANINSQEVWQMLLNEAEIELDPANDEDACQSLYGRIIRQSDIEALAKEKLEKYRAEIDMEKLDSEFMLKWNVNKNQITKLQDAFWNDELKENCSTEERYKAALELCSSRDKLFSKIYLA